MTTLPQLRVLYDGECGLCARTVRFLFRHERDARFVFTPFQSELGQKLASEIGIDPFDPASFAVIEPGGRAHLRSGGMFLAISYCRNPWSWLARVASCIPRALTDSVYGFIARNRMAWFGRSEICDLPDPGLIERLETGAWQNSAN